MTTFFMIVGLKKYFCGFFAFQTPTWIGALSFWQYLATSIAMATLVYPTALKGC